MSAGIPLKGIDFCFLLFCIDSSEYDDSADDWPTVCFRPFAHIRKTGITREIEVSCVFNVGIHFTATPALIIIYYQLMSVGADCSIEIKRDGEMANQMNGNKQQIGHRLEIRTTFCFRLDFFFFFSFISFSDCCFLTLLHLFACYVRCDMCSHEIEESKTKKRKTFRVRTESHRNVFTCSAHSSVSRTHCPFWMYETWRVAKRNR